MLSAALNIDTMRLDLVSFGNRSILQGVCVCACVGITIQHVGVSLCVRECWKGREWHSFSDPLCGVPHLGENRLSIDSFQITA